MILLQLASNMDGLEFETWLAALSLSSLYTAAITMSYPM